MNRTIDCIRLALGSIEETIGDMPITSFDYGPGTHAARVLVGWNEFSLLFAGRTVKNSTEGAFEFMEIADRGVAYATSRRTVSADRDVVLPPVESSVA